MLLANIAIDYCFQIMLGRVERQRSHECRGASGPETRESDDVQRSPEADRCGWLCTHWQRGAAKTTCGMGPRGRRDTTGFRCGWLLSGLDQWLLHFLLSMLLRTRVGQVGYESWSIIDSIIEFWIRRLQDDMLTWSFWCYSTWSYFNVILIILFLASLEKAAFDVDGKRLLHCSGHGFRGSLLVAGSSLTKPRTRSLRGHTWMLLDRTVACYPSSIADPKVPTKIIPYTQTLHSYGKSPFLMGKSTINGNFQ